MLSHAGEVLLIVATVLGLVYVLWTIYNEARLKCPSCGMRKLRMVNFIKATVIVDGHSAPDSWKCLQCAACGARFRRHFDNRWESVPDGDVADFDMGKPS